MTLAVSQESLFNLLSHQRGAALTVPTKRMTLLGPLGGKPVETTLCWASCSCSLGPTQTEPCSFRRGFAACLLPKGLASLSPDTWVVPAVHRGSARLPSDATASSTASRGLGSPSRQRFSTQRYFLLLSLASAPKTAPAWPPTPGVSALTSL